MRATISRPSTALAWGAGLAAALAALAGPSGQRQVAVTFDDLPAQSTRHELEVHAEITRRLVEICQRQRIPAIGFVNENKLEEGGEVDPRRVALLERWLDAGLELGNHGYSHLSLYRTPLADFQDDVVAGERVTRRLLKDRGRRMRYFRHPFLNTGPDLATKTAFESFLESQGYRVAPVTIDNSEWIFARAYDHAIDRDDDALASRLAEAYLDYMEAMFAYYEQQSTALLGYELKQILLLHANRLNADHFGALVERIRRRGYAFVPLEQALEDPAYQREDRYTGTAGITWLHRWALTEGKRGDFFGQEPEPPAFVIETSRLDL